MSTESPIESTVQTHVDREFPEIRIQLTREAQTSRDTGHYDGNEVVEVTICRSGKLQGAEMNIIKCLVVDAECFVRVLHELVNGKRSVIRLHIAAVEKMSNIMMNFAHLNDCIGNLGTRNDGICAHHPIGVLLADFRNKEGTHAGTSTTSEGVSDLET